MVQRTLASITFLLFMLHIGIAQNNTYPYEASKEHPYGLPNPDAPEQIKDYALLIGECDCKSFSRQQDLSWAEPVAMIWRFKYIMNGMAVQDETLKADGRHSGSIRQYIADSSAWYVHYYSSAAPSITLPVWEGGKTGEDRIVLYRKQKAPNGTDGHFRLTFSEISDEGFNWVGEWVDISESFSRATWKIECVKR